jgi:hypothetical protein
VVVGGGIPRWLLSIFLATQGQHPSLNTPTLLKP